MFYIVITDLDGTLLDHRNYSYAAALPAIRSLQQHHVPLILCSSKTAAEIAALREELGIDDPFIVENGGGIYFRPGLFYNGPYSVDEAGRWNRITLGIPYARLKESLLETVRELRVEIRLFEELSPEELNSEIGLSGQAAERALNREFDVPFQMKEIARAGLLERELGKKGLRLSRGGRFFHVTGDNDKGRAAQILAGLYSHLTADEVKMVGVGDSKNDRPLLEAVDYPILVPNPASSSPVELEIPLLRRAPEPGPAGWNHAILDLIVELQVIRQKDF